MRKTIKTSLLLCVAVLLLCSCGRTESISVEIPATSTDAVVQGADDSITFSAGEAGVLRIKDGNLLFFDYASRKNYVICSRANCRHDDSSCSGWYSGRHGALGLAEYGGKLYCLMNQQEENLYELVRMDADGNHRKVIAELARGDSAPGKWAADFDLSDVYYAGNKLIAVMNWTYNPADKSEDVIQTQQCVAVDLQSGEVTEVTLKGEEEVQCAVRAVSKDCVVTETCGYEEPLLTEKEFYEQYEQGGFADNDTVMKAKDPYAAYQEWYFDQMPRQYQYILFDLEKEESRVLEEGTLKKIRNDAGEVSSMVPPFYILGGYDGDLLIEEVEEGTVSDEGETGVVKNRVYRWNLEEDQKELLLDLDNGYVFDAGGVNVNSVIDGDTLLFLKRKPGGKADYFRYSLETGETERMYEADRSVPYRIVGETKDSFIYYTFDDTKKSVYMTDKESYYKGSFADAVRLAELDEHF